MPANYKKRSATADRWLSCLLALRLRQIERTFPDYGSFVAASGLSKGTMLLLRYARGNPTFRTLSTMARGFGIPVWSLLAIREETVRAEVEAHNLPYDRVVALLEEDIAAGGRHRDEQADPIIPPTP